MPAHRRKPKYRLHKPSGQAVVTINGHDHYLGRHGTPESEEKYDRLIAEWWAAGGTAPRAASSPAVTAAPGLTVNGLILAFMEHAKQHYRRPDGTTTSEVYEYAHTLGRLRRLYGRTAASEFGPLALKAVRQSMIDDRLARKVINQRIGRIRRLFKWGASEELVPVAVHQALGTVTGLQRGRTGARETDPVRPVSEAVVEATLPHMPGPVAAMVRLQLLTGMRPGEAVVMRTCDLDTAGPVWLYTPGSDQGQQGQHKTAHHGHRRVIPLGPKAQEVVRPFLKADLAAPLFSPREFMEERREKRRAARKSKVQPSQADRRKRNPRRRPGDAYTVPAYDHAIRRACDSAHPLPDDLGPRVKPNGKRESKAEWWGRLTEEQKGQVREWRRAHRWHPHQLRHTAATKLRREFGLDTARVVLGHRSPQITELYAELDVARAAEAMGKIG